MDLSAFFYFFASTSPIAVRNILSSDNIQAVACTNNQSMVRIVD